jgi:hypothetical protein
LVPFILHRVTQQNRSAELELLLLCARTRTDEQHIRRIRDLLDRNLAWNEVVFLAGRHGLTPFLHRTLSGLNSDRVPGDVQSRLRSMAQAIRFQNLGAVRELIRILRALETAGIAATPYKGPALAAFLCGDYGLREFCDVDILVRPSDALRARGTLLGLGYVPKKSIPGWLHRTHAWFHCSFTFRSSDGLTHVDMNWGVLPRYWRIPGVPEHEWENLGRLSLAGASIPWFSPECILFLLCLHGSAHKWDTLKWIVDIAEMLRAYPDLDWGRVTNEARRTGSERMVAVGLVLACDLLGAAIPAAALNTVRFTAEVASLAEDVRHNLEAPDPKPLGNLAQLAFIARVTERLQTKISCRALIPVYFVLNEVMRPGLAALRNTATH